MLRAGFINYDDDLYVSNNPRVKEGLTIDSVRWALTAADCANWHPLTWLSLQLDAQWFGVGPRGFHLTNLLLHAANSVLLFWVLQLTTGAMAKSACVAALFALHPLHVESVAWIAERKDVLSALFAMLTLLAYLHYVAGPMWRRYLLVLLTFALGLMAKPMLVTLPCVLLLLDYWPLSRCSPAESSAVPPGVFERLACKRGRTWSWLIVEKLPLFALSAASSVVTVLVQHQAGSVRSAEEMSFSARGMNALIAYAGYLAKTIWPTDLAVFYPHPRDRISMWPAIGAGAAILAITGLAFGARRTRPYLFVGWCWFLGMLFPVIGIVQVGDQAMADRYMYLPMIGLLAAAVWGACDAARRLALRPRTMGFVAASLLVACAAASWRQSGYWLNSLTLWRHAIDVTEPNPVAYNSYGVALLESNRPREAVSWLRKGVELSPQDERGQQNLGMALGQLRRPDESIAAFEAVLRINPRNAVAHYNLGVLAEVKGQADKAVERYREALEINADYWQAHLRIGRALYNAGDRQQAERHLAEAVRINPGLLHGGRAQSRFSAGENEPQTAPNRAR